MANTKSAISVDCDGFLERGWFSTPIIDPKIAEQLAEVARNEALDCVFRSEWKTIEMLEAKGINPTRLLVDPDLRKKYLTNPSMVWRNDNPRTPLISKNCGMVNIYHQPDLREWVLFNPDVVNVVRQLYSIGPNHIKDDNSLVHMCGPDRFCLKPHGATDMPIHVDSNITTPTKDHTPSYRVQSFVTLRIGTIPSQKARSKISARDLGSIEVFEGFHHYYDLFGEYLLEQGLPKFKGNGPFQLKPFFDKYLNKFLKCVEKECDIDHPQPKWVCPSLVAGDLFSFDWRLPHRNTRNKSDVERIVAYSSLYRRNDWKLLGQPDLLPMFTGEGKKGHCGSNLNNYEELAAYKDIWSERVKIDTDQMADPTVREVLALD